MGGVRDDRYVELVREGVECAHVGHLAEQVDREECAQPGAPGRRLAGLLGVEVEATAIDVGEDRCRAEPRDGACRCEERVRRAHDLVIRFDAQRHQCEQQRVRSGRTAQREAAPAVTRKLRFESLDLGTEHEALTLDDPPERRIDLRPERLVLGLEVEEGDGVRCTHRGPYLATALSA